MDKKDLKFSPSDLHYKDDAYHGSKSLQFTEWWYFDAVLNDGFSVQMSMRVLSGLRLSFVFLRLDIYKDGDVVAHQRKLLLMKDVIVSHEMPLIKIAGKNVMKGYIDESTGKWIYDITLEFKDTSANLNFIGCTKGWKEQHHGGDWWGVALPRAEVKGKIKVNGKEIEVYGTGYHDHNWEVKIFAIMNFGWYWGKINSKNYTVTWGNIMKSISSSKLLIIINKKYGGYINIKPENIRFTAKDFQPEKGKQIPSSFSIDATDENISLHIDMKSLGIHHFKIMGIMNYWRYHVRCTGFITVDSKREDIDEIHIAEFLRFK